MNDPERISAEMRNKIDQLQEELRYNKDRMTVETQHEFNELSDRWEDLKRKADVEGSAAGKELKEAGDTLADEFRNGFQRISDLLKS